MDQTKVLLYAVGDVGPNRDNPESIFAAAAPTLKKADILFGQLEAVFTERPIPQCNQTWPGLSTHPKNVSALTSVGFDVLSFASNHLLDCGEPGLLDTIDLLRKNQITVIGAGKNLDEARKPAIFERNGTKVAFLAYCSVLPLGYEARRAGGGLPEKPGAAPMRVSTSYTHESWQPGTPPRIITLANKEDLEAMKDDIAKAKSLADVVVVSQHWGIHYLPGLIAMYQKEVAYAAIDAGADLLLGHHPHLLKGIEIYKGKVIFYSIGNFAFDLAVAFMIDHKSPERYGFELDPEYPTFPFPPQSRKTMIVKCVISDKKVAKVSFLPALINKLGQAEVLPRSDKRSSDVVDFVEWSNKNLEPTLFGRQKLSATRLSWEGDEVVINIKYQSLSQ
ncbi:MAG: CapA family protein [Betaproteobacteria bacterium]|nr:CapA family protein [Betaproteobacteria bacterium]